MSSKRKASELSPDAVWSVGPSDNFSDWTIEVTDKENGEMISYHVHRRDLALGLCKSEYFATAFRSEGLKESHENVTRLELESKVAQAFPIMLNYLYTGKLNCETKDVMAIFWLSDYFMIESMQVALKNLVSHRLRVDDAVALYEDAVSRGHEEAARTVITWFLHTTRLYNVQYLRPLMKVIDPEFLLCGNLDDEYGLEDFILYFMELRGEDLDNESFSKLIRKAFSSSKKITVDRASKMAELLKHCTKVDGLPVDIQKRVFLESYLLRPVAGEDAQEPRYEWASTKARYGCDLDGYAYDMDALQLIWEAMKLARKIPNLDENVLSTVCDSVLHFFTNHPEVLERLKEDEISLLYDAFPKAKCIELVVALQKQCGKYKGELRNFRRFDEPNIQKKVVSSYHRSTGPRAKIPDNKPRRLPEWADKKEEGWVYKDKKYGIEPLYRYRAVDE